MDIDTSGTNSSAQWTKGLVVLNMLTSGFKLHCGAVHHPLHPVAACVAVTKVIGNKKY